MRISMSDFKFDAKIFYLILLVIFLLSFSAQAKQINLIEKTRFEKTRTKLPEGFPKAKRFYQMEIKSSLKSSRDIKKGDKVVLDFFTDAYFNSTVTKVWENINKTTSVRCKLDDFPLGEVFIATTEGRTLATISVPELNRLYLIQSEPETKIHYLIEADMDELDKLEDAEPLISYEEQYPSSYNEVVSNSNHTLIDVMIVYSPAAKSWADSSGGGIDNVIASAMNKANTALDNTGIGTNMHLAYSGEVNYTESGDSGTDLSRLTYKDDGYADEVHTLRDQYGADLVAMYLDLDDTGGRGWLLKNTSGSPSYAFSLTRVQQASWTYTTIHEWGHNMGCHHRIDQTTQPGPGLFSYSAGWRWIGSNGNRYCSVMSYEDGDYSRVGYFSNPEVYYYDIATGDYVDGDNAKTISEIKDVIAGYRESLTRPIFPDITGDGRIDFEDYSHISGNWLKSTALNQDGDVTGNGYVDYEDLASLADNWLWEEPDPNFFKEELDSDPGWSTEGLWQFGVPTGQGGSYGNADPSSGYTGDNVYGYNLNGDYESSMPERNLTTPAIDCSGKSNVHLKFYRWLNVESSSYDHAYVKISNDGISWTVLWENDNTIEDDSWNLVDFDISAYADNESTVYIRWTMGTTDGYWHYSGWNIDDICLYEADGL